MMMKTMARRGCTTTTATICCLLLSLLLLLLSPSFSLAAATHDNAAATAAAAATTTTTTTTTTTSSATFDDDDDDYYNLAKTPPMGWNAWYAYFRDVDEFAMKEAADQIVALGLKDLGYQYVNLDDSWMADQRDPITQRLVPNATKFPSGFLALSHYIHDRGLKMGVYSSAGTMTCVSLPGSMHYEEIDAQTLADWEIDFLKYDDCYGDSRPDVIRYAQMRNALRATGRPILFSLCNGGANGVEKWAPSIMGHMWRSTTDILRTWQTIEPNFWNNQQIVERMQPFGTFTHSWPDPDMLQIGPDKYNTVLPLAEQRSQFGLWVLAKAPLILSTNLTIVAKESLDIITHRRLIDLHQNMNYPPARCYVGCRVGDKETLRNGTWSDYSVLATTNLYYHGKEEKNEKETGKGGGTSGRGRVVGGGSNSNSITVAIVMNWKNDTLANFTLLSHDIGIVPMPNTKIVVTDVWTGQVVRTVMVIRTTTLNKNNNNNNKKKTKKIGKKKGRPCAGSAKRRAEISRGSVRGAAKTAITMTTTTTTTTKKEEVKDDHHHHHQLDYKSNIMLINAYEPIPIEIPPLDAHDNVIFQFETSAVTEEDENDMMEKMIEEEGEKDDDDEEDCDTVVIVESTTRIATMPDNAKDEDKEEKAEAPFATA